MTRTGDCDIINNANREDGEQEFHGENAGVAELADARDLKSRDTKVSYRFDPGHRHHRGQKKRERIGRGANRKESESEEEQTGRGANRKGSKHIAE